MTRGPTAIALCGIALAASLATACGDGSDPHIEQPFFPEDLAAAGFVQIRECRSPGEHSALGSFTVWVDGPSADAFGQLWADPPARAQMPPGSVVVKQTHDSMDCSDPVVSWLAMKKEPGLSPATADWHWQEVDADGDIVADGPDAGCVGCHRGSADTSCTGYGANNGRDFICTAP